MNGVKNAASSIIVTCTLCLVACMVVTLCFQVTEERITQNEQAKANELRLELLPDADSFTKVDDCDLVQGVTEIYKADNKTGWIITAQARGYQGWVTVMTGIDQSGKITSVKVTDVSAETAGIGTKLTKQDYLDQYRGASSVSSYKGKLNSTYIEAVSGASYTSEAVFNCVSLSFMQVQELIDSEKEAKLYEQKK
ncbi:MAG: FMN-binding protein [Firmicutes bacterium]|nr:FMN-binding protein [Bacillota bacterium]